MNVGGVIFASLTIVGAIAAALAMLGKTRGTERTVGLAAVGAAAGVGVVNLLKYVGWLAESPIYWTFNIAFVVLFWTLVFELIRSGKRRPS